MAETSRSIFMPAPQSLDAIEWRDIPGIFGYQISEYGHVRRSEPGKATWPGRLLRPKWHWHGYPRYALTIGGKNKSFEAHYLVAIAFIGPRPAEKMEIAHGDGQPENCHYTNLRWCTHVENEADKARHGTGPSGENNGCAKLTAEAVRDIRARYGSGGVTYFSLADEYGVTFQTIAKVVTRARWAHID